MAKQKQITGTFITTEKAPCPDGGYLKETGITWSNKG